MEPVHTNIDEIEVEQEYVPEIALCLLHTVIFQRALAKIKPTEQEARKLNIRYV
jgi:hypothetical protein